MKYFYLLFFMLIFSCQNDKPYQEFEKKLIEQVSECVTLDKLTKESNFLKKYEDCSKKTSFLLKNGLDHYADNPNLSKEEYKELIPEIIQDLVKYNKCK